MADIQPTDQFLVNRADTTQTVEHADLMAELQDTDLMLVNRANQTYTITGEDLKDSVKAPLDLVVVLSTYSPQTDVAVTATGVASGGTSPYSYTYQWQKDGSVIAGATNASYTPVLADVGLKLKCVVEATDSDGDTVSADSPETAPVTAADYPPSVTGATLSGGPGFSGKTYTTTLQGYDPGQPAATKGMKAKVYGSLQIAAESSVITGVTDISPNTSQAWSSYVQGTLAPDHPAKQGFDGNPATAVLGNSQSDPVTFADTLTGVTSLRVQVRPTGNPAIGGGFKVSGTGITETIIPSANGETLVTIPVTSATVSDIVFTNVGSNSSAGFARIEVNGRVLIDPVINYSVWSDYVITANTTNPENTFDGNLSTESVTSGGSYFTFTPTVQPRPSGTDLAVYVNNVGGVGYEGAINGISYSNKNPTSSPGWVTLGTISNGSLDSFTFRRGDTFSDTGLRAISIDGKLMVDTTVSGQVWSDFLIDAGGNKVVNPHQAFDGNTTTRAQSGPGKNSKIVFEPTADVAFNDKLEVMCDNGPGDATAQFSNAAPVSIGDNWGWITIYTGSGVINSTAKITIDTNSASQYATLKAVRVDGAVMVDSAQIANIKLTLTDNTNLNNGGFVVNDKVEMSSDSNVTGVLKAIGDKSMELFTGDTWLTNNKVVNTVVNPITITPLSDEIVGLSDLVLTLSDDKDLNQFAAGDDVYQDGGYTVTSSAITDVTGNVLTLTDDTNLENFRKGDVVQSVDITITEIKDDAAPYKLTVSGGSWSNGDTVSTVTTAGTGVVASTDPSSNTMTLSSSDDSGTKRWIVNGGRKVTMNAKAQTETTGYLEWSGAQVTGVVRVDPGYKPADPSLQLTFTDPAPTGDTWDTELPTGTTIQTRVLATNTIGSVDSGWSNTVIGLGLSTDLSDGEYQGAYLDSASHIATFANRAEVYQGQLAQQKRDDLNTKISANLGISTAELNELVGEED